MWMDGGRTLRWTLVCLYFIRVSYMNFVCVYQCFLLGSSQLLIQKINRYEIPVAMADVN